MNKIGYLWMFICMAFGAQNKDITRIVSEFGVVCAGLYMMTLKMIRRAASLALTALLNAVLDYQPRLMIAAIDAILPFIVKRARYFRTVSLAGALPRTVFGYGTLLPFSLKCHPTLLANQIVDSQRPLGFPNNAAARRTKRTAVFKLRWPALELLSTHWASESVFAHENR
jgi:hypothetical protein